MIAITKSMVALSALASAGLVAAFDIGGPRTDGPPAATQVAQRFPLTSEMFSPTPMTSFVGLKFTAPQPMADGSKGDKMTSDTCTEQDWPYFSQQCLVTGDGKPASKVHRVITIERRIGENTSELMQMPMADLAQR